MIAQIYEGRSAGCSERRYASEDEAFLVAEVRGPERDRAIRVTGVREYESTGLGFVLQEDRYRVVASLVAAPVGGGHEDIGTHRRRAVESCSGTADQFAECAIDRPRRRQFGLNGQHARKFAVGLDGGRERHERFVVSQKLFRDGEGEREHTVEVRLARSVALLAIVDGRSRSAREHDDGE